MTWVPTRFFRRLIVFLRFQRFPPFALELALKRKAVEINVHDECGTRLLQSLRAGEIELALLCSPVPSKHFETEKLLCEELVLALSNSHRLAGKEKISLADLTSERFILLKEDYGIEDKVLAFCDKSEVPPHMALRCSNLESVQSLVKTGIGISLIPKMAQRTDPGIVYRSLEDSKPSRTVLVAWRKNRQRSSSANEFLAQLRLVAKRFGNNSLPPEQKR